MHLHDNVEVRRAISPTRVADNTAQVSQIIDMQGVHSLEFVVAYGTLADADATFTALVEHGDNSALSDAATAASFLLGSVPSTTFAGDDTVKKVGYIGNKRYVRLTITPAANTGNADLSAVALCAFQNKVPTA
jgi:hypothetical protein